MAAKKGMGKGLGKGLGRGLGSLIPTGPDDDAEESGAVEDKGKKAPAKKQSSMSSTKGKNKLKDDTGGADQKTPDKAPENAHVAVSGEIYIKTALIEPNKNQPRKEFDIESIKELSESILEVGLLQPIVVRKKDNKYYEIIAGERRWRAAKLAKLKEVPVVVKDLTPEQIMEAALIENIQREDLNPIEEAMAFENLINEYGLTQEEAAKKVSKSRAQISNIMRLLKLDPRVQSQVVSGVLTTGHARALLAIEDGDKQTEAAKLIIDNDLSVRDTEKLVKDILAEKPEKKTKKGLNPAGLLVYRDMEKKLSDTLGSKVAIKSRDGKKGKIEIEYFSSEELERLYDKLGHRRRSVPE